MKTYARAVLHVRKQLEAGLEPDWGWLADEMAVNANYFSTASFLCEVLNPAITFKQRKPGERFEPLKHGMAPAIKVEFQRMLTGDRVAPARCVGLVKLVGGILYRLELSPLFLLSILDAYDWLLVAQQPVEAQLSFANEMVQRYLDGQEGLWP